MSNLRCYINDLGMLPDTGDHEGCDVWLEPLFGVADALLGYPGVTRIQSGSATYEFEVAPQAAVGFLENAIALCLFPVFYDDDKPQWATALAQVLEGKGLGVQAVEDAIAEDRMKHLRATLGGHFGAKLRAYLLNPTQENFMEAYVHSAGEYRTGLVKALVRANEWEGHVQKPESHFEKFREDWCVGRRGWDCFIVPGIPTLNRTIPGVLQWMREQPVPRHANPALDGGG